MNITDNTNPVQLKKPSPLTRAAGGLSIGALTNPDTEGARQYSPNYCDAFAYRGGSSLPRAPGNGSYSKNAQLGSAQIRLAKLNSDLFRVLS